VAHLAHFTGQNLWLLISAVTVIETAWRKVFSLIL